MSSCYARERARRATRPADRPRVEALIVAQLTLTINRGGGLCTKHRATVPFHVTRCPNETAVLCRRTRMTPPNISTRTPRSRHNSVLKFGAYRPEVIARIELGLRSASNRRRLTTAPPIRPLRGDYVYSYTLHRVYFTRSDAPSSRDIFLMIFRV